jgi:hypothetical protein
VVQPIAAPLSDLQRKILQVICTKENVTYRMLTEKTKRDRITILQSIESLIKRNHILKQKSNPEYEKSILIFKPTLLGKCYACSIRKVDVDLEDILKLDGDDEITNYLEIIKNITNPLQRKMFIQPLSELFSLSELSKNQFKMPQAFKERVLKKAFKEGVLKISQNNNFDPRSLLNERSVLSLKKLFTPIEIKELEDYLVTMRDNLSKTIDSFPDY